MSRAEDPPAETPSWSRWTTVLGLCWSSFRLFSTESSTPPRLCCSCSFYCPESLHSVVWMSQHSSPRVVLKDTSGDMGTLLVWVSPWAGPQTLLEIALRHLLLHLCSTYLFLDVFFLIRLRVCVLAYFFFFSTACLFSHWLICYRL